MRRRGTPQSHETEIPLRRRLIRFCWPCWSLSWWLRPWPLCTCSALALVLTLAGWKPAPALVIARALLPRRLARAAGLPRLANSGRWAELVQAHAVATGCSGVAVRKASKGCGDYL